MSDNPGSIINYNEEEIQERIDRYEMSVHPNAGFYRVCKGNKKKGDPSLRVRRIEISILYMQREFARMQKQGVMFKKNFK